MVASLISWLVAGLFFAILGWALYFVCVKFKAPDPVYWICGVALILILLAWATGQVPIVGLSR